MKKNVINTIIVAQKWFEKSGFKKILKYNHGEKSLKIPFFVSFDVEVLLPKMLSSQKNPEKSYTDKKAKHIPSGCAWSLTYSFDSTKNQYGYFRGGDCI